MLNFHGRTVITEHNFEQKKSPLVRVFSTPTLSISDMNAFPFPFILIEASPMRKSVPYYYRVNEFIFLTNELRDITAEMKWKLCLLNVSMRVQLG